MQTADLIPVSLVVPADTGLEIESITSLKALFEPFFVQAEEWRQKALACKVTDIHDKRGMKFARESRLALKEIRVAVEKRRKEAKEDSLRRGKAIDGFANIFKAAVEPIESFLLEQEEFAERTLAAQKKQRSEDRAAAIMPFTSEGQLLPVFDEMTDEQFAALLQDTKAAQEARIKRAQEEEAARLAKEQAEAAERERVRLENERLKQEAIEREAAAKKEREAAEAERQRLEAEAARERAEAAAKLKAEQEKVRKAQEEALALKQAQEKAAAEAAAEQEKVRKAQEEAAAEADAKLKAEQEAQQKAAQAPDKEKIMAFAQTVRALKVPDCSTEAAKKMLIDIQGTIDKFALWIESNANTGL